MSVKTKMHIIGIPILLLLAFIPFGIQRGRTYDAIAESAIAIESAENRIREAVAAESRARGIVSELNAAIERERADYRELENRYTELEQQLGRERESYEKLKRTIDDSAIGIGSITAYNAECSDLINECIEIIESGAD